MLAAQFRYLIVGSCVILPQSIAAQIIPPSPASKSVAEASAQIFRLADDFRKAGKNDEALAAINQALRRDPDCGRCYGLRSGILGNLQRYEEGVADSEVGEKLSQTSRDKAMSAYNHGFNLGALNRHEEALEAYRRALDFDPSYEMAHFGRAKLFNVLSLWAESKEEAERALGLSPKHGAAWAYLAEAQLSLNDLAGGLFSANKAVELAPTDSRSFLARARAHALNREFPELLSDVTRSLELDPNRPHVHLLRGHALGLLERYDEARAEYAQEPDQEAVLPFLQAIYIRQYGTRIYNCGDESTEIDLPLNQVHTSGFEDCKRRIEQSLVAPPSAPEPKKRVRPGPPQPASRKK